jgi:hypothetical protein
MGAPLRIALEYCARLLPLFEVRGQRKRRCSCAFRRPTGLVAAGIFSSRLNSPANSRNLEQTSSIALLGGNVPQAKIPVGPGYQTPFADQIRREANILTGAVGMITSPIQAEHIVVTGQADAVIMTHELLRHPYRPMRAARELGQPISWPVQYLRAAPEGSQARVPVDLKNLESCFEEQHAIPEG